VRNENVCLCCDQTFLVSDDEIHVSERAESNESFAGEHQRLLRSHVRGDCHLRQRQIRRIQLRRKYLHAASSRLSTCLSVCLSVCLSYFGGRSFAVARPKAWNQLPADIRAIDSVNSFKSALKTFLFR